MATRAPEPIFDLLNAINSGGQADVCARTFDVDVKSCARCGGTLDVLAVVTDHDIARKIRDAIHSIAPSISAIARAKTTVAFFDAARLQRLCERSPEQVVAVLERLG